MKKFTLKDVLTAACTWTPPEKRNEPIKQSKESPKKKQPIKKGSDERLFTVVHQRFHGTGPHSQQMDGLG